MSDPHILIFGGGAADKGPSADAFGVADERIARGEHLLIRCDIR
jgi:hypothetical protein